jgi:hypothetical protein
MNGSANRRRGHSCERAVVRYLRDHGFPDAVTTRNTGGAGGRQLGDVSFHPLVVLEAKDVAASSWGSWLRQAEAAAGPDRVAAVVRRTRGVPDVGEWRTVWLAPDPNPYTTPLSRWQSAQYAGTFATFVAWVAELDQDGAA